jgi:hypothetical protein
MRLDKKLRTSLMIVGALSTLFLLVDLVTVSKIPLDVYILNSVFTLFLACGTRDR